jgi:hypothetical protein
LVFAKATLDHSCSYFTLPNITGMTDMHHHAQLFFC